MNQISFGGYLDLFWKFKLKIDYKDGSKEGTRYIATHVETDKSKSSKRVPSKTIRNVQ